MIYSVSPKKSGIYIIYVNVEHKKYFKNKMTLAPTGVQTKTSNESDRSDVAASETEDLTQKTIMEVKLKCCLLYTSPSPRDGLLSRMPSSA